jgi:hypothetical protein
MEFVTRHVPEAADTKFFFEDLKDLSRLTGGITIRRGPVVVVMIGLTRERRWYPRLSRHSMSEVDATVGGTMLHSWEEEVVFTMLHEARHVRQFARGEIDRWQEVDSEIDAERFARRLLKTFRRETDSSVVAQAA